DPQAADHLHLAVAGLGHHPGLSGLDGSGGGLGIEGVGLALAAPGLTVGSVDLDHDLGVGGQEAGEGSPVAAGALHPPDDRLSQLVGPAQQLLVAGRGGGDLDGGHRAAELVVGVGDMEIQVGVDPDGELGRVGVWDAGHGCLGSLAGWGMARAPAGRTALRGVWAAGSYQVTAVRLACRWRPWLGPTGQPQGTRPDDSRVRPSPRSPHGLGWRPRLGWTGKEKGTTPAESRVRPAPQPPPRSSQRNRPTEAQVQREPPREWPSRANFNEGVRDAWWVRTLTGTRPSARCLTPARRSGPRVVILPTVVAAGHGAGLAGHTPGPPGAAP